MKKLISNINQAYGKVKKCLERKRKKYSSDVAREEGNTIGGVVEKREPI